MPYNRSKINENEGFTEGQFRSCEIRQKPSVIRHNLTLIYPHSSDIDQKNHESTWFVYIRQMAFLEIRQSLTRFYKVRHKSSTQSAKKDAFSTMFDKNLVEGCQKIAENGNCFRQFLRDYDLNLAVTPLFYNFRYGERSKMSENVNYRLTPYKVVGIRWLGEKFVVYNRIWNVFRQIPTMVDMYGQKKCVYARKTCRRATPPPKSLLFIADFDIFRHERGLNYEKLRNKRQKW